MSPIYSILLLIGFLALFVSPSLASGVEEDASLFDSEISENDLALEDEELWGIDSSLRNHHHHRRRHHHAPPPQNEDDEVLRKRRRPPHHHRRAPSPAEEIY